jgi:glycerophosphoryl diester phosphodiesterase
MVLRIGHRGAAGHAPENTLQSFEKAVLLGCDMTELDVHLCLSGELVVIHDETVDRTTDGSGLVSELVLNEIKLLNAGKGEEVPTLDAILSLLRGMIKLNIELKGLGTAKPVHDLVKGLGWDNNDLTISSFNWDMLKEYRVLDSNARLSVLTFKNHGEAMGLAEQIDAYSINPYHLLLNKKYVEEAHNKGFMVYSWTPNKESEIKQAINKGVDGVISDYPDRIT